MSNRNIYEVFCRENQTFRALETVEVFTNLTLDLSDDELCFFKIEESLYRLHGLVSLETCIFCEKNERLALKIRRVFFARKTNGSLSRLQKYASRLLRHSG